MNLFPLTYLFSAGQVSCDASPERERERERDFAQFVVDGSSEEGMEKIDVGESKREKGHSFLSLSVPLPLQFQSEIQISFSPSLFSFQLKRD